MDFYAPAPFEYAPTNVLGDQTFEFVPLYLYENDFEFYDVEGKIN